MSINIGRGKFQQNSILYPNNVGLAMVAKNRIQQAVGMQNARHIEALKVDGVDLQIWLKNYSGQLCSCGIKHLDNDNSISGDISSGSKPFEDMTIEENWDNPCQYDEAQQNYSNYKDYKTEEDIDEDLITRYAENYDNSLIFGGDKTPCGICYGTGYKEGYQLYNGKRYVLDYYDNPEIFGFLLERTYPASYVSKYDSNNYIIWKFKAPTFFKEYLGIRVRNNIEMCSNYSIQISFDGINYIPYNDNLIKERNHQETTIYLKIIPYTLNSTEDFRKIANRLRK